MEKLLRTWKKQEKRIIRLCYRKGLIEPKEVNELYWEQFKPSGRKHKSCNGKYSFTTYLPEVHFCTVDYWGEADEHGLLDAILEGLYWDNVSRESMDNDESGRPESTFKYKGRQWFIKYLNSLPTVRCDSKINKVLNYIYNN